MSDDKIHSNNLLTKEHVAKMLGTNRTYLSQIINERTHKTFTQYVNTFRIEDAIRILFDVNNEIPIKAISVNIGFSSRTTFYNVFQESVGMSPARYLNSAKQLHKKRVDLPQ